ncbi:HypC/HybG/HupF family hydrogenase formation chaperone [Amycolatopsis taiwanensis]|uniref:Hydrogenase assembly protein HupF n=1 Tax=Amycolatopsis taiwanensis TaxID=342230 RepID=A0A9W6R9M8_9PSEU|nr:HypC/HybG/HupF family hydrogenase formation chaperone [Amycolatopsis taiwanensis]GLY70077.1 hydrogenase assembly protein HupF [Amycolatopsis taiwanensis]
MNTGPGACSGGTCVTCSDRAVAVTVVRLLDDALAEVDPGDGRVEEISVALVTAQAGDTVLVHAGEAIGVITR